MKKYLLIFSLIFAFFAFSSCGDDEEIEMRDNQIDSLQNLLNESDSQVQEFMQAFNEIQANLNTIKQKEHIIDLNAVDSSEMTPDMVNQINNDVMMIYELMQENKDALATLKNKLKSSGTKNKELEDMIGLYDAQMAQKDEEISLLKQKLEEMDFNMQELNSKINNMQSNLDTLKQVTENQDQTITEQDILLHTTYYVIGTKDELKNNGILTKDGILSKLSLDADFNKTYFTKVDYRNISEIPINTKKIEILTQHPSTSFSLVENDGQISKLKITKQDEFWSMSKFLVIMLK
ncbi:MAG: hypothetical protein JXL97_13005 [Bacteroidales bacterium]|nr:hypothetical protein [Bacteroidales bacterium]